MKSLFYIISLYGYKKKYNFFNEIKNDFDLIDIKLMSYNYNLEKIIRKKKKCNQKSFAFFLLPPIDPSNANKNYILNLKKIYQIKKIFVNDPNTITFEIINTQIKYTDIFFIEFFSFFLRLNLTVQNFFRKSYYKNLICDYEIHTGQRTLDLRPFSLSKKIYWYNYDYYNYKKEKLLNFIKIPIQNQYAVYLDQNFDMHTDINFSGNKRASFNFFYNELNNFFLDLKKKDKLEILIAKHPKRTNNLITKRFKNLKNYKNNTMKLVEKSKIVFLHCTLSINFAILMNKDIVFLTSNELNKSPWGKRVRNFSLFFNCKPLNISDPYNSISDYIACKKKYSKYINFYIRHKKSKYLEFRDLIKNITK